MFNEKACKCSFTQHTWPDTLNLARGKNDRRCPGELSTMISNY